MHNELTARLCQRFILRSGIKNLIALIFLSNKLRCEFVAELQTGAQYSKQGRIKALKQFLRISCSPNILKDFLKMPIFCAMDEDTERTCFSKVNFESSKTPSSLKESPLETGLLSI